MSTLYIITADRIFDRPVGFPAEEISGFIDL